MCQLPPPKSDRLLVECGLLGASAERRQCSSVPVGLSPDRRYRDDLFVQAGSAGAVKRETAEQHHARLSARAEDDADSFEVRLETLL